MESSSGSDSSDLPRGREAPRRPRRDRGRSGGGAGDVRSADISQKISTLASTLQDTSRNLTKVDRMLGQYREQTDDQADAMAVLRDNLEESISQLQAQRCSRSNGAGSVSGSTLHSSDLDACSASEGQRFYPTSPLRDYTGSPGRRRRSRSAGVHFRTTSPSGTDIHTLHQSLRDLHCDQQRLSVDLDSEILRRNRSDIDTRRALESLTQHMATSQRQESVSSRVERRLHELERQMCSDQRSIARERRPDQRAAMTDNLQETSGRHSVHSHSRDEVTTGRLLKAERDKLEQELQRARRLLEQSEDSRQSLTQQVEDMQGELLRARREKTELQKIQMESPQPGSYTEREGGRGGARRPDIEVFSSLITRCSNQPNSDLIDLMIRVTERSDQETEVAELRVQLCKASAQSEIKELKRSLDCKEKERLQLSIQVEELSSELAQREQQQLRMLEQLKDIQTRGQAERRETAALLQESRSSRDELKTRAQEAVHRWRSKCRRLQKELEEVQAQLQLHADEASQTVREKESSQAQMKALSQQTEAARRELTEILGRLARREEELHRKDVELSETCQRHLSLEQEIREVKNASAALQEEARRQANIQARLREENQRLEERADSQARRCRKDQNAVAELQVSLKQMTSAHAQLAQRLAQEERTKKELQTGALELQAKLTVVQEERAALGQQLQLEREVHQKELDNLKMTIEGSRTKREVQDLLTLCRQERDELKAHLKEVKVGAASDRERCEALCIKLDRMKEECDKLAAQLGTKEEEHTRLHNKYQLLKQELDDRVRSDEWRCVSELALDKLEEKVVRMEADQEAVLTSVGEELDAACRSLARNGEDKLQVISQKPGLVEDPRRWLAETKTKLRWLCEEVRESDARERRLKKQQQQTQDQLKALRQSWDSEQTALLQRLDQQEKLLQALSSEKKEVMERSRRKDEDMRSLQDRVLDLEMNTRAALDHLESIPEKHSLMEDFKDLEESQRQKELVEQRYAKYKEMVWDLQHQLDESKRKIQEYREEKLDATSRSLKLAALSSSIRGAGTSFSSSQRSDALHRRLTSSILDDSTVNGAKPPSD
ncbi:centrosomal protein of 128 kDa [Aulostomus maculatus]